MEGSRESGHSIDLHDLCGSSMTVEIEVLAKGRVAQCASVSVSVVWETEINYSK